MPSASTVASPIHRRSFLGTSVASAVSASLAASGLPKKVSAEDLRSTAVHPGAPTGAHKPTYQGPNVILIRFGGGARRREAIDPAQRCYSPYLLNELVPRGVLMPNMQIGSDAETGHGQGTLNLLTGIYDKYQDVKQEFLQERFEARVPTLFEYLREAFDVPSHAALIINGEDRTQEEFYTFSNHHLFGVNYRSEVLSLFRFKEFLLKQQLAGETNKLSEQELAGIQKRLAEMQALDYRKNDEVAASGEIDQFWSRWRSHYGDSGYTCPRGDRLLTELASRALRTLRPRLMMINYNDCDYVHWGNMAHYTTAISIMDQGIRRLVEQVEADEFYRDNTLFVIAPDCGRDDSRFAAVPCQHHFNSPGAREVFALFFGAGIDRGYRFDKPTEQIQVASTIGTAMGLETKHAEAEVLSEVFA